MWSPTQTDKALIPLRPKPVPPESSVGRLMPQRRQTQPAFFVSA